MFDLTGRVAVITGGGGALASAMGAALIRAGARVAVLERWGRINILLNAAGGNIPRASRHGKSPCDLTVDALDAVLRLNCHGTVIPTMVFGEHMAAQK